MSESMASPWIRDYLIDVAETHGAQLYSAQVSKSKKRVQLTDFLTYHVDSYVWAWISDKDYRVSVRFSKDAAEAYKSKCRRNIFDSRYFVVFISNYRPMFSPRPIGPNTPGNTPVSYISLEVDQVTSIGSGTHLFGNPRDLELDESIREWILGLREDGGGGNVLMLRKQQKLVQNTNAPSTLPVPSLLTCGPSLVNDLPVSRHQTTEVAEDAAKPKPERPQDFKRAYAKRWRVIEVDRWKFADNPAMSEKPAQMNPDHAFDDSLPDGLCQPRQRASECPESPSRTPSRAPPQQQGTPTNWSPSTRGSPRFLDEVDGSALLEVTQHRDEPMASPAASLLSDAEAPAVGATFTSNVHSLQPPTPAQRTKYSPPPCSSLSRSSPEPILRSPRLPSSLLLLSPSLPPFFSDVSQAEQATSSRTPKLLAAQKEVVQEMDSPAQLLLHDSKAWKEPSFIARNKGKGTAHTIEEPATPTAGMSKKRRRSACLETPVQKRVKVDSPTACKAKLDRVTPGHVVNSCSRANGKSTAKKTHSDGQSLPITTPLELEETPSGKTGCKCSQENGRSTAEKAHSSQPLPNAADLAMSSRSSRPRLASYTIDFEDVTLGKGVPIPTMTLHPDIKQILLTTGRVRKSGDADGSVYIVQ